MMIPLGSGVDLTEDVNRLPPGTLSDCLNYEIAYSSGYRRIDGFLRYDGRPEGEDLEAYRAAVQTVPNGAYGVHFFPDWANDQGILYAVTETVRFRIENRGYFPPSNLGVRGQRAELFDPVSGPTGIPNSWILEPEAAFGADGEDYIEVLTTSGLGAGRLQAYTGISIINGMNIPLVGDWVESEAEDYRAVVRGVEVLSGSGPQQNLVMTLWVEQNENDTATVGQQLQVEVGNVRIGDIAFVQGWSTNGNLDDGIDTQIGDVTARMGDPPDGNNGVILRSTDRGWEPLESAYEARFKDGIVEPSSIYIGTGESSTSPAAAYTPTIGDQASDRPLAQMGAVQNDWVASSGTLSSVIQGDDGTYAESSLAATNEYTKILTAKGFNVFVDPLDEVTGVTIEVVAEKVGVGTAEFRGVALGQKRGQGAVLDTKQTYSFGSATDLWGFQSWQELVSRITNPSALTIGVSFGSSAGASDVRVYSIRIIVHKRGSDVSSSVFLRAGNQDWPARVLYTYKRDGAWADGNAEGLITLGRVDNPSKVFSGSEIRSESGGGGVLLARLDGPLTPVRLPSRARLSGKESRLQFINTNFFAAGRLTAVYGVSGAGPAFTFNSEYFFRIYTGRSEDEPRHIARHADRLALGFENGDADFSVTGRPDLFDGTLNAFSLGFGQRITGMLPLTGGALGVWTEDSTHIVKGSAVEEIQQQVISPTSGAIEYTACDMGIPVFCDYRGINTLVSSQKFGDFDMGRLSTPIRSWLLPRLQSLRSSGDQRPFLAHPVQQKNQYRLWFADGQILTMTFLDDQQAKFTFQRYTIPSVGDARIQAVTTGLDRELSSVGFAIFEGSDYVYRLDHTNTFDGDPIPASFTLNPMHITGPGKYQRLNLLHVHGLSDTDIEITSQIGINYDAPAGHETTATLKGGRPTFTKMRHKSRGKHFSIKIDTSSSSAHTLQNIELPDISPRQLER